MSVGSNPDGGYLVPDELAREIGRRLADSSPIRSLAGVRQVSASLYKKPFMTEGPAVGWVGETDARPQTASPTLAELSFPAMELYAMPAATATLLEDAAVDIDEWLASEVEQAFAEQEGAAFMNGDGVNKPKGFLSYDKVANGAWEWGKLGYVPTGVDGGWPADDPSDVLIEWTSEGEGAVEYNEADSFSVARRRRRSVRYCWARFTVDNLLCNSLSPASRRAICRGQAMERYAACIAGRPIPPLSY
jgi:predicted phage gp36 major capsid-like protein